MLRVEVEDESWTDALFVTEKGGGVRCSHKESAF
jgi:hypothetical protein